ncbi:MAG: N-acetylmuramoyl-L-alanine amidase [Streptomyces sp.]|nr:N-acetylmuramoyl-L-alanine amidase [Streptomyces sp.]NUS24413.1 N-acetylmuramoyl-L-alanine amidase [Streptomyces sp.]
MAWYPGAIRLELQPESRDQPAITPTQFILHSIAAPWDEERIYEYWRDSTNLESHFGLAYDGGLGQFLSTDTKADANYKANARAISVETASNLQHTDPWTEEQIAALIKLGVWAHREHGIPLQVCRAWDQPGFGFHRLFREWSTSGTECPGDARVNQFHQRVLPGIIAAANGTTTPEEDDLSALSQERSDSWNSMIWGLKNTVEEMQRQLAALQGAVTAMTGLLTAQHSDLTAEQIEAAVKAGTVAGLKDGAVSVDINVHGTPTQP